MMTALLLAGAGLAMDIHLLLNLPELPANLSTSYRSLAIHAAACVLFAIGIGSVLPLSYRKPRAAAFVLAALVTFFMPVLGMLGLGCCAVAGRFSRSAARREPPQGQAMGSGSLDELDVAGVLESRSFSKGYLSCVLLYCRCPLKRIDALHHTLNLAEGDAVRLLRIAMKDEEDDVRLLAYALATSREKAIEARIKNHLAIMRDKPSGASLPELKSLAGDYVQLSEMAATQSAAKALFCKLAGQHAAAALQLAPGDIALMLLLARTSLSAHDFAGAERQIQRALGCGMDQRTAAPILAEIAFHRCAFAEIEACLSKTGWHANPSAREATAFWQRMSHDIS